MENTTDTRPQVDWTKYTDEELHINWTNLVMANQEAGNTPVRDAAIRNILAEGERRNLPVCGWVL